MTDNEITKALERCFARGFDESTCYECPFYTATAKCTEDLRDSALDLINRQKAKIEALQMDNKQLQSDVINANQNWDHIKGLWECEKEKVESAKQKVICDCKMLKTAKSEAIKEFAEELEYFVLNEDIEVVEPKCKDYESYINGANQFRHQIKNGINNLVEERKTKNDRA